MEEEVMLILLMEMLEHMVQVHMVLVVMDMQVMVQIKATRILLIQTLALVYKHVDYWPVALHVVDAVVHNNDPKSVGIIGRLIL
jgi:hypothetical protein